MTMQPSNQKHLYHILVDTIEQVRSGTIKVAQAHAISDLAARANTAIKIEHDRQRVIMEIESHKARTPNSVAALRNLEGKNY